MVDHSALEDEMGDKQWNTEAPEKTCEYKISVLITKDWMIDIERALLMKDLIVCITGEMYGLIWTQNPKKGQNLLSRLITDDVSWNLYIRM